MYSLLIQKCDLESSNKVNVIKDRGICQVNHAQTIPFAYVYIAVVWLFCQWNKKTKALCLFSIASFHIQCF